MNQTHKKIAEIIQDMKNRHLMKNRHQEVMVIPGFDWECFEKRIKDV